MNYKEEFLEIFNSKIKRNGSAEFLAWLNKTDFFVAPASTKFHLAEEGGLCQHSINVYKRLKNLVENEYGENWRDAVSEESVAIIGLLHDICKVNYYKIEMKNVKVDGAWVQQPFYTVEDNLPYGHGEKSVYIINGFLRLTREEAICINWHMGGFDPRAQVGYTMQTAFYDFPLAVLTHIADMQASYLDEKITKG